MNFGRTKILRDETEVTAENVAAILFETFSTHSANSADIETLYNEYKGDQDILDRIKTVRPEICNKIVENHSNEFVSFKVGYLCGEPIQYVSRGDRAEASDAIGQLNDMMVLCSKDALDDELIEWIYICGQGYRMGWPNSDYINSEIVPKLAKGSTSFSGDESPFDAYTLDPRHSYVVYHSGLGEKPLMGVKIVQKADKTTVFSVYTRNRYFEITTGEPSTADQYNITKDEPTAIGMIPIVEYTFNNARLGIFEIVRDILNAMNNVASNRADAIAQFVESLVVLYNCDIDDDMAKTLRDAGLVKLKSLGDVKADIKIISEELSQMETQKLVDYMYQTCLNIVGMPNRNGGSSTSDTGLAVVYRDGWEAAEARAKRDETAYKRSERQFLKIALRIARDTTGIDLKLSEIGIRFTRRNYSDVLSKSQVLTTMLASPKIAPILAFRHCGLFCDPEDAAKISEEYAKEQEAKLQRQLEQQKQEEPPDGNSAGGNAQSKTA